jgi:two-component system alkaline phosphatase synthesis response regulator PhoP
MQGATAMARKILIVDDESHILHVLSLKLRNAGYDVLTALDGEEGFDCALRDHPDLIITDYQMPYMTGLELCRALGQDKATTDIPVVMLTARGYALESEDLSLRNIREVVTKPFSPRAIVDHIHRILSDVDASRGHGAVDESSAPACTDATAVPAHPIPKNRSKAA